MGFWEMFGGFGKKMRVRSTFKEWVDGTREREPRSH